jgi:16S rRNA (cytidine1402-2'-O)-methyltransferase
VPGKLFVIATPLGHLDDLSPRAREALARADCIACEDTRRTARLLARFDIDTPMVSYHGFNEKSRLEPLLARLDRGQTLALVCDAGTPAISDPGALLVAGAVEAGHAVSPLPGPCAVTTLLSVSGLSANRFVFEGFLPHRAGERRRVLRALSREDRPVVVYETPRRIRAALDDIAAILGDRMLVLGRELTKIHESILRGTAQELLAALDPAPRGEVVLAIAPSDGGAFAERDAEEARTVWREELDAAGGDTRAALKRCGKRLDLKRAELYRLLVELGERVER